MKSHFCVNPSLYHTVPATLSYVVVQDHSFYAAFKLVEARFLWYRETVQTACQNRGADA
jgi:hypothetical protein